MNPFVFQVIFGLLLMGIGGILVYNDLFSPTRTGTWMDLCRGKTLGGLICLILGTLIMVAPVFALV